MQNSCPSAATNPSEPTNGILQKQTQNQFAWHSKLNGAHPTNSISDVLDATLKEYSFAYSMWWTNDNTDFMLTQGLPKPHMMPALFDNNWEYWGWKDNQYSVSSKSQDFEPEEDSTITL